MHPTNVTHWLCEAADAMKTFQAIAVQDSDANSFAILPIASLLCPVLQLWDGPLDRRSANSLQTRKRRTKTALAKEAVAVASLCRPRITPCSEHAHRRETTASKPAVALPKRNQGSNQQSRKDVFCNRRQLEFHSQAVFSSLCVGPTMFH